MANQNIIMDAILCLKGGLGCISVTIRSFSNLMDPNTAGMGSSRRPHRRSDCWWHDGPTNKRNYFYGCFKSAYAKEKQLVS
jgi:hypothetical protein